MLWSARGNSTRYLEPRERSRDLHKEPRGGALAAPYAPTRPPETTCWPRGVSTRKPSYLFDELRSEYEEFPHMSP
jgi:hypothetical protein